MAHRVLHERTKRIEALAQDNEGWIDALQNRVEELEMCKEISEDKMCKQERAIRELECTVSYLQSAVRTITSPASAVAREEGVTPMRVPVTPMRGAKRRREQSHTPPVPAVTRRDLFSDVTESVTPISEVVKKEDDECITDSGNEKRARHGRSDGFELTFDETATQKPPSMDGSQSDA